MQQSYSCDDIYQILQSEIIDLTIKPGTLLSENALCARFGVSRTPIRSVLQRLQENALVQIKPYKGTVVTLLDFDIVNELIYQRVAVESMVLRDFTNRCTPLEVEQLRNSLRVLEDLARQPNVDVNRFYRQDSQMHEVWFQSMRKMYLWECIQRAHADYSRFRMLDIVEAKNIPEVIVEHGRMLEIVENKELCAIEPLMEQHLYGGIRRLGPKLFTEFKDYFIQPESAE